MNWKLPVSILALSAMLAGCSSANESSTSKEVSVTAEEKIVIDELNREVTMPIEVNRVVMGSILPYFSTWYVGTNSTERSWNASQNHIMQRLILF